MRCRHSACSLLFRDFWGGPQRGQQQSATQTLGVHLLGMEIWKVSSDAGSHTDLQNPTESSQKEKPIRNFSIEPSSVILTRLQMPVLEDAVCETSSYAVALALLFSFWDSFSTQLQIQKFVTCFVLCSCSSGVFQSGAPKGGGGLPRLGPRGGFATMQR